MITNARPWQPPPDILNDFAECKLRDLATVAAFASVDDSACRKVRQRLAECSPEVQVIVERGANPQGLSAKLVFTGRCKQRFCSTCAKIRSQQVYAKVKPRFEQALASHPGCRAIFMTRTVPSEPIREVKRLQRLLMKAAGRMARAKAYRSAFIGRMTAVEVTVNHETRLAHVHQHEIALARAGYFSKANDFYLTHEDHERMWRTAVGADRRLVCDIRPLRPQKPNESLAGALSEICKYPLRPKGIWLKTDTGYSVAPDIIVPLHFALKGCRLYAFGGVLRGAAQDIAGLNSDQVEGEWAMTEEELADFDKRVNGEIVAAADYVWSGAAYEDVRDLRRGNQHDPA